MKSMSINRFGGIDVFEAVMQPIPKVLPGHVLIKVIATSVNPLDYKLRQGLFPDLIKAFPAVLHGDIAGIIEKVGEGVQHFSVGDEVYGCVGGFLNMGGGLAEYILADVSLIAHKPKALSLTETAALPLVAITAWEGLVTYANVQQDQTVLIHGGTGGVGHIAIQLAKWLGAKVYATSSSLEKMDISKQLGADFTINYKDTHAKTYAAKYTQGHGFDVVFDTVGGNNLEECFDAAAPYGQVISILGAGKHDVTTAFQKGLSIHMVMQPLPLITGIRRTHYHEILSKIAELVDAGVLQPLIDKNKFRLDQVGAAHAYLEQGNAIGKVVIENF